MAEEKENPADYGYPKTQGPMKGISETALKKDIKAGKVVTGDDAKTSTETPDPNVATGGLGDTLTPTDSPATTTSTTTRSTGSTS